MNRFSKIHLACVTAPLALALAACSGSEDAEGGLDGDAIAAIEAPEGTSWTETVTVSEDGEGYILGNPDAPLKLVEYASHTCGACANFSVTGKPSLKDDYVSTGVVSFEQREVFLQPTDVAIATLARCGAKEQYQTLSDEVWRNLNQVFQALQANQAALQAVDQLPKEERMERIADVGGLIDFFAARGLSADLARTCLRDADKMEAMIEAVEAKNKEIGITGTPTFTLNGRKVDALQWPDLEPILQRAGARQDAE
ncbi:MAG: thioredoxin domain-containing protein [Pseudomonadota bacterium]